MLFEHTRKDEATEKKRKKKTVSDTQYYLICLFRLYIEERESDRLPRIDDIKTYKSFELFFVYRKTRRQKNCI